MLNGHLHGWLFSPYAETIPLLLVDDKVAIQSADSIERPDVAKALAVNESRNGHTGFAFKLPPVLNNAKLALYAATANGVSLVAQKQAALHINDYCLFSQLARARVIQASKNAVAIVCGDFQKSTIARAVSLYYIAARERPAIIFCYKNPEDCAFIPLLTSDIPYVSLDNSIRNDCLDLVRAYSLKFATIWICNRNPAAFELAANLAQTKTSFILDLNADQQQNQKAQTKSITENNDAFIARLISKATAATRSLSQQYNAPYVPDMPYLAAMFGKNAAGSPAYLLYLGSQQQNLPDLASAIKVLSYRLQLPLELYVLEDSLELGQNVADLDMVPIGDANIQLMKNVDIVFLESPDAQELRNLDNLGRTWLASAIAAGLPVVVAKAAASAELAALPGIFTYTQQDIVSVLDQALKADRGEIARQRQTSAFNLPQVHAAFAIAEKQAAQPDLLAFLKAKPFQSGNRMEAPALLAIWKQDDAGIYGRRIDQICRSYKRKHPDHRIFVLELSQAERCAADLAVAVDDAQADYPNLYYDNLFARYERKGHGYDDAGIYYQRHVFKDVAGIRKQIIGFLAKHRLLPDNTVVISFPVIPCWQYLTDIFEAFPLILDVVDNELGWAATPGERALKLASYFRAMRPAKTIIFNSKLAQEFFQAQGFVSDLTKTYLVPNWYSLPDGVRLSRQPVKDGKLHLFYSGNMNDRLDWRLLTAIAAMRNVQLHLAGEAQYVADKLRVLLDFGVIYHGITGEQQTLALIQKMDAAIVPHVLDDLSSYMNPIKISMYQACGLPIIYPAHLGSQFNGSLDSALSYGNMEECLELIANAPVGAEWKADAGTENKSEAEYLRIVESLREK